MSPLPFLRAHIHTRSSSVCSVRFRSPTNVWAEKTSKSRNWMITHKSSAKVYLFDFVSDIFASVSDRPDNSLIIKELRRLRWRVQLYNFLLFLNVHDYKWLTETWKNGTFCIQLYLSLKDVEKLHILNITVLFTGIYKYCK